jgi:hypothetical protein
VSDATIPEATEAEDQPASPAIVTAADFDAVDFEAPIRGLDTADAHEFYQTFASASVEAREAGDTRSEKVHRLLAQLCSVFMRPSDTGSVWQPVLTWANGTHSPTAESFHGEQTTILASVVSQITSLALRARIADVAWSNCRRDGASSAAAIEAYTELAAALLDGRLKTSHGQQPMQDAVRFMHRAMQIAKMTTKRTRRPAKIGEVFETMYAGARDAKDISSFVTLADLGIDFGLRQPAVAAAELESAASEIRAGTYPMAVKRAWDLAAQLHFNLKDPASRQRCLKQAVMQTLAMREEVNASPAAEASWVSNALLELRHIDGMEDLKRTLEGDLRALQQAAQKHFGSFEVDLQIGDTPERITEYFSKLSLSECLKRFAQLTRSRDPTKLRKEALEVAKAAPLMAMMSAVHLDAEGRTESRSSGAPHNGEPDESWYRRMIGQSEKLHRARMISAAIDPARMVINARFGIEERHFRAIIGFSGFAPESQKPILALGFVRLFQGDMMSATHLLIPQLEPCLRHLLKVNGHDPSRRRDDATEEDHSLSGLYTHYRAELETILTPAIASEIDLLFNAKPGPELRHELAHGQLSAGACFHEDVYYGNWLIFHLCSLLVMHAWDQVVTPDLAGEE